MKLTKGKFIFAIAIVLWIVGCNQKKGVQLKKERGFLVLIEPEHWMFYPVNNLDSTNCQINFSSENLKTGMTVPINTLEDSTYTLLIRSMDTLNLLQEVESSNGKIGYILVTAAQLEYQIDEKFIGADSQLKSNFSIHAKDRTVKFVYNQFPITISRVSPIFCFGETKRNILPIECQHNDRDPEDYLYKICEYISSSYRFSNLSRKYKIKAISTDTLENRSVVRVELSCCGLGDVAYFDSRTKKIIKIKYGAK